MKSNRRILPITTPHYIVKVNGRPQLDKLTLAEAAALLARNDVKIDDKHLTLALWAGVTFRNGFGFPCMVSDELSISHPLDGPPTHLSEAEFYDLRQSEAAARQKDFETRISEVGG
jgi:hypothetical protein